jgi:hypothetical protein
MTVTKKFAVEVDTELADLYDKIYFINARIAELQDSIKFYIKRNQDVTKYVDQIEKLEQQKMPFVSRRIELTNIFNQDPWTRAFLVINSNGHVHSSMDCSTCFSTTRYNWLVQYSNDDETTIVSDAGQDACTVCYPSAPADVLNRPSVIVTADKIAKAEAKVIRDAKREAKIAKAKASAPTASGEALVIVYPSTKWTKINGESVLVNCDKRMAINTERTAVSTWLSNAYWIKESSNPESIKENIVINARIVEALAGKNEISIEEQTAILNKKLAKRR